MGRPDRWVGREIELATLTDALDRAPPDRAGLWLVGGTAGIGKTRLARAVSHEARRRGWRSGWAYGWDGTGAPPFWPWTQVLRTLLERPATQLTELVDPQGVLVDQFELFDAAARALATAAGPTPLLLVLDDLHLADTDSLHLLRFLLGHGTTVPLVVLGTYRPDHVHGEVAEAFSGLDDLADRLPLTGLTPPEVGSLLGLDPTDAPHDAVHGIHRLTGGNPLFVEEIARSQRVRGETLPAPATLREATRRRLERLPVGVRTHLAAVAVLGPHATRAGVHRLAAELGEDREGLTAAVDHGLVETGTAPGDPVTVVHPLFAEVGLDLVARPDLERLHARAAALLAGAGLPASTVASHLALAGETHRATAVTTLVRAGQEASARFAHASATGMLRRAVELLEPPATDQPARQPRLHFEAVLALAGALHWAEGRLAAEETYRKAEELARSIGDPVLLARSAARHGLEYFTTGDLPRWRSELASEALRGLPPGDSALRATLMAGVSAGALARLDLATNRHLAEEAVAMARRVGDPRALGTALVARQVSDLGPAGLERRLADAREILALAEAAGDPALAIHGRFLLKTALLESGDLRELNSQLNLQQAQITRVGEARWARHSLWFRCMQAMLDGEPDRVEELAGEIGVIADRLADPDGVGVYFGQLGVARWLQGRVAEMEEAYLSQLRDEPDEPLWPSVLAWVALATGRTVEARGWATHFPPLDEVPESQHTLLTLCCMADVVAAVGGRSQVEELRRALTPYADRVVPIAMGAGLFGTVARHLATLALRLGHRDEAILHCERALAVSGRLGARPWIADAQLTLAEILLSGPGERDVERAAALVTEAATVRRTGTVALDDRIDRLSRTLTDLGRGPGATRTPPGPRRVEISVLGSFEVRGTDGQVARWNSRKARTLLKVLVAHGGALVSRERVMAILWPAVAPEALGNRFSVALSAVRRALDPTRSLEGPLVVSTDDGVRLVLDHPEVEVRVDALALLEEAREALAPGSDPAQWRDTVDQLTRTPFAEETDAGWAGGLRSEVTSTLTASLRRAIASSREAGDHLATDEWARRLLEVDPYDEHAHRARVTALRAAGAHGRADQAMVDYRTALEDLGLPAPAL